MAGEVVNTYSPPTVWFTIEDELALSPGQWSEVANVRFYAQAEAEAEAQKRARDNKIRVRVVQHDTVNG